MSDIKSNNNSNKRLRSILGSIPTKKCRIEYITCISKCCHFISRITADWVEKVAGACLFVSVKATPDVWMDANNTDSHLIRCLSSLWHWQIHKHLLLFRRSQSWCCWWRAAFFSVGKVWIYFNKIRFKRVEAANEWHQYKALSLLFEFNLLSDPSFIFVWQLKQRDFSYQILLQ